MSVVSARRVGPDDWRAWREVRLAALAESPEVFPAELTRARRYDESDWRERLDPDSGVWALAVAGEDLVGQVGAWLPFGSIPMLVGLWVRPAWRGRGVGDVLVAEVLDWARQRSHGRVDLWVLEHNAPARRLYERHGFTAVNEYMPSPDLPRAREQLMVCHIGS
ncbi:MAG: GNAT family N-acetyltransferase [Micromonosporaceae bacterium]|nr:GNAT family N-acetyltransferase [Micromonosporaceae bacterium]